MYIHDIKYMILLKQINLVYFKKFFSTCTRNSTQYLRSLVKYETKFSILREHSTDGGKMC